jgi:DNA polymerase
MSLDLDERQRAMLQEMGVRVWQPDAVQKPGADTAPASEAATHSAFQAAIALAVERVTGGPATLPTPARATPVPTAAVAEPLALQGLAWPDLVETASACQACGLCAGRKHSTLRMPDQPVQADWMVVGDPPDEDEDRMGQPFVEQTGLLLDNMLKAVGASRSGRGRQGAYLSNVVKCRPPMGRLPQAAELAQCAQYLKREIALVQPKLILAMGRFAAQLLLEQHPQEAALPLGKQRGRAYRYCGVPVIVSYHPKVLLRASTDKAKAWADLCLAMDVLES